MIRRGVFACGVLSLGAAAWAAGSQTYDLNLYQKITTGGVELQPGEYKLDLDTDRATLRHGKVWSENAVRIENAGEKYLTTSMVLVKDEGKFHIREIHLGGTNRKIVFTETQP